MKSKFGHEYIDLLGFRLGKGKKFVDPSKADALERWPDPKRLEDIVSFRAYANFIREFIPGFMDYDAALRKYTKKGAKFSDYVNDTDAQKSFSAMRSACARSVGIATIDYIAAADPSNSGRPLEAFIDASDIGWGLTLTQRQTPGGLHVPVAVYNRSWTATEQAWSTFERELAGLREGLAAINHLSKGFLVIAYTDHQK